MDWLSSIRTWLSDNEAMISAIVGLAVLAGIVFTGIRFLLSRRSEPSTKIKPEEDPLLALPTGPVVAVLPFENLSRDLDQEYFSDGLTDDIITALSRFRDLFVIARNSTFRYKRQAVDVRRLNKELGARYVLEGSVRKAEARLRVTAQLLDARDGTHLWAESYDRDLSASDIFDIQDQITEQVVATLAGFHGVISRARFAEVKEKPTDSLDAYECVLRYGAYTRGGFAVTEHARLRDALEDAVKTDPSYAEAWACLSAVYLDEYLYDYNPRPDPLARALEAARRAAAADPLNQHARFILAYVHFYGHDIEFFVAEGERAIALNPNNAIVLHAFGDCLQQWGDERGIAFVRKALALDPFHPTWYYFPIAHYHFERGEYEAALAAARRIDLPDVFHTHVFFAAINAELGRQEEARNSVQELLRVSPGFTVGKLIEDRRKWNATDDSIRLWVAALRKAGLPE